MLLAGDNMQKEPPNAQGEPWFKGLVDRANGNPSKVRTETAEARGLDLLAGMPLYKLERLMRAQNDQQFVEWQRHMRRTDVDQPVCDEFIEKLKPLQTNDLDTDPNWAYAPIGVLSTWERDTINYSQTRNFAKTFGLPFVTWPLPIVNEETLELSKEELDRLREEEPERLSGYFVESAPCLLSKNIKAVRKLVNGTPALGDSLQFENNVVPEQLKTAYEKGTFSIITLEKPPKAINLLVGGKHLTWHGVPLDDLSELIESDTPDAQVVPIMEGPAEEVTLRSVAAAQFGLDVVNVKKFTCNLAFAITDFKLQGRTLPKLILYK